MTAAEARANYAEIQAYVLERTGLKVSCLYIAQVKARHGIIKRECCNKAKTESSQHVRSTMVSGDALWHFQMIR